MSILGTEERKKSFNSIHLEWPDWRGSEENLSLSNNIEAQSHSKVSPLKFYEGFRSVTWHSLYCFVVKLNALSYQLHDADNTINLFFIPLHPNKLS